MNTKNIWLILIALIIIAVIAGISFTQKSSQKEQVIKIGVIMPLTGPAGVLGNSVMAGMKLAMEHFNKEYSSHYFLDFQDTQGNPKQAVDIYQRNKALYSTPLVLSWMSHTASALIELTEADRTVLFMGAAKSSLTDGKKFAIRVFPNAIDLANMAIRFIEEELKPTKMGVYYINDDYGRDVGEKVASMAKEKGIEIVFVEPVDSRASNFRDYVVKHSVKPVDLIYLAVYGTVYPSLLKEIKQYFPSTTRIFADITFSNYNTQQQVSDLGEGVFTIGTEADDKMTTWGPAQRFQRELKSKFHLDADFNSALGYDMAWIAMEALFHSKNKQSKEIVEYIVNKSRFEGVSGLIKFKPTGDGTFTLKLLVRDKGTLKSISKEAIK